MSHNHHNNPNYADKNSQNSVQQNADNYASYYGHEESTQNAHCPNCNKPEHKNPQKPADAGAKQQDSSAQHAESRQQDGKPYADLDATEGCTPGHRGEQEYFPALHDE